MDQSALSSVSGILRRTDAERNKASTPQSAIDGFTQLVTAACDGLACIIQWQSPVSSGTSTATTSSCSASALSTVLALVERRLRRAGSATQSLHLRAGEITAHRNGAATTPIEAIALASADEDTQILSVAIAPLGRSLEQMRAAAQLANDATRALLRARSGEESITFWRARSSHNAERLAELTREREASDAATAAIEATVAACSKLPARNRFANLGAAIAGTVHCDAWLIVTGPPEALAVVASSPNWAPAAPLEESGAVADAIRRSATVVRRPEKTGTRRSAEDRIFAGYAAYLCVPFDGGAIALAARQTITDGEQFYMAELIRRLRPLIQQWLLEDELNRAQGLVRTLGVRLFTAIDHERQRIARDLHDHQAQLITAARIALEAGPTEARGILKQLDDLLRLRIRELRPATLGRATLDEALSHEIRRLNDAGIKARIVQPAQARRLSRPIQQLCYQLVREALSNVIRHAAATRVTIAIEQREGLARIVIDDNGKGFASGKTKSESAGRSGGSGLSGMAERVELMGGQFSIERIARITRLTAAIPEL